MQLTKYLGKYSKSERAEMIIRGLILSQFAIPIGSALYYLWTQVHYLITYQDGNGVTASLVNVGLKDTWDRLPVHVENLFHQHWFTGQLAPAWWVVARHDFRHVLIGFLAVLLVGAFGVGLKKYNRRSTGKMVLSVPYAFLLATVVAAVLIVLAVRVTPVINHYGVSQGIPFLNDLIGKGTLQLTIIGLAAGEVARRFALAPTFAELQTRSIERNIAQGDTFVGWKKLVYGPNYRKRYEAVQVELAGAKPELGTPWIGVVMLLSAPVLTFLLGFGVWLNYFGPAATAVR